jgi:hypothetical protein
MKQTTNHHHNSPADMGRSARYRWCDDDAVRERKPGRWLMVPQAADPALAATS